jgi:hypothetical protein
MQALGVFRAVALGIPIPLPLASSAISREACVRGLSFGKSAPGFDHNAGIDDDGIRTTTQGYSGTPLAHKLGIKPGARLALINAPDGFDATLGELPGAVTVRRSARGTVDLIVAFFTRARELERRLASLRGALDPAGGLWLAWPKRASGVQTDLSEGAVRELGLAAGLVDNKVCAIDPVWSGLRFVYRLADRPGDSGR